MSDYEKSEGVGIVGGGARSEEEAVALHHLATADPEPERDGLMTGPAHEKKYDLDRAEDSEARWRAAGVHPFENRALRPGEDGYENLHGVQENDLETATAGGAPETADAPRASDGVA